MRNYNVHQNSVFFYQIIFLRTSILTLFQRFRRYAGQKSDNDYTWQIDPQQTCLKRRVRNFSLHGAREYPRGDDLTHQIHSENPWIINSSHVMHKW